MGADKSGLVVLGETLLTRLLRRIEAERHACFVLGPATNVAAATCIEDALPHAGPLAALAGLESELGADIERVFVAAVDMPLMDARVVEAFVAIAEARAPERAPYVVLAHLAGHDQVLAALWSKAALAEAPRLVASGERSVRALAAVVQVLRVDEAEFAELGIAAEAFWNINRPEDLERLRPRLDRS